MATSVKDTLRNGFLSDIITGIGATGVIAVFSGAKTGKTTGTFNADPTGLLVEIPLASTPFGSPSGGSAALNGGPLSATASGGANTAPLSYRIKTASGGNASTVVAEGDCDVNGTPTAGKLTLATNVTSGQTITVSSFALTAGNA